MSSRPLLIALSMVVAVGLALRGTAPAQGVGPAVYPDLQTLPPDNLVFDTVPFPDGKTHHVLRFDNTVWNAGEGRLELEGKKRSKIYQNVYDAPVGGNLVQRIYLGNDSIFHPGHGHYHLEHFASYVLLRQDPTTHSYQPTTNRGTKTSFCIVDTARVTGTYGAQYTLCGRTLQGLTVGWADIYRARLDEQWIDLGPVQGANPPLPDGEYAVQSTANPGNGNAAPRLSESNYANNVATRYFGVVNGALVQR